MSVSILLDDGSVGVVTLTPSEYLYKSDTLPIQLIYLQQFSSDVTESFRAAAFAAYQLLREKGLWKKGSGYAFVCELKDQDNNGLAPTIHGESGGLALSLALVAHILRGSLDGLHVAATGEIAKIADGTIGPVAALAEKLRGAIATLPAGSRIYYPGDNNLEKPVLEPIKADASSRKIALIGVNTLEEAARILLPAIGPWAPLRKALWFFVAFCLAYLAYAIVSYPAGIYFLERGRYELSETHLGIATRLLPWQSQLKSMYQDLTTPFQIKVQMRYLLQSGVENTCSLSQNPEDLVLSSSDSYVFRIRVYAPVYLYVIETDSGGSTRVRFPSKGYSASTNPLGNGNEYRLPDRGIGFPPEGYKGVIETHFIASVWRCKDIEEAFLFNKASRSRHVRKSDLEVMILKREREGYGAHVERMRFRYR